MDINKHYIEVKRVLRKNRTVDPFFTVRYTVSPYRGCVHGCMYCDGRAEKYYVEGDFSRDIVIRERAADLLAEELALQREYGAILLGSGVSDPYHEVEREEKSTRKIVQVIADVGYPVVIATKSTLVLRDLDLLKQIAEKSGALVLITVTSVDDRLGTLCEPGAATISERLAALRALHRAGIPTGALCMPLLPGLADSGEQIATLFATLQECGVSCILPGGLTLRPGIQKATYMELISRHFPEYCALYHEIYREERASGAPLQSYSTQLYQRIAAGLSRVQLPDAIPYAVYHRYLPRYDLITLVLERMKQRYAARQINIHPLKKAMANYKEWVEAERHSVARHKNSAFAEIDQKLAFLAGHGLLGDLLGNTKLADFIGRLLAGNAEFDDRTGKLLLR